MKRRSGSGKADHCFYIIYWKDDKKICEKVGLASAGYTAQLASQIRAERLRAIRHG